MAWKEVNKEKLIKFIKTYPQQKHIELEMII